MTEENKPNEENENKNLDQQDELKKKLEELEAKNKEKDSKIQELETTVQTINKRFEQPANNNAPDEDETELKEIENMRSYDPDGAAKRNAQYLKKRDEKIAKATADRLTAQQAQQDALSKIRNGVKSSNPNFSDAIVDSVMQRAELIAASGKVKTAEDAVNEAVKFVKSELDAYASKSKAVPGLPAGAGAEGGSNPAPTGKPVDKTEEPSDFVEKLVSAKEKKIL